jgi:hypothetical protein
MRNLLSAKFVAELLKFLIFLQNFVFIFGVCCNLCSSEEEEFLAELLEKILL